MLKFRETCRETFRPCRLVDLCILPHDNPLSRKVFDSITTLKEEVDLCRSLGFFIIHPCSRFKLYWDLVIVVVLAVNLLVLPVQHAFFNASTLQAEWLAFSVLTSSFYFVDMMVNLFSGRVMSDRICLDRNVVVCRYLKRWFLIDLLAAIPFDVILNSVADAVENDALVKIARSVGMLKIVRMPLLVRLITTYQDAFLSSSHRVHLKLINVLLSMLLLSHLNACLLYFVPMIQGFPKESWVVVNQIQELSWYEQYIWSFFGAICIMIGIGFGKSEPKQTLEVIVTCFMVISGAAVYGVLLANGTALVQNLSYSKTGHEQIMSEVKHYSRSKKLPQQLQKRLRDYFENRFKGHYFDEDRIISQLSEVLREDVLKHNCRALVRRVPVFTEADPHIVTDVISRLRSEFYQPGDVIVAAGTAGTRMFFLQSGNVQVTLDDGTIVAHLKDGSYFGEMCLLRQDKRNASVIAEAYCVVYSLATDDFNETLKKYPSLRQFMEKEAEFRSLQNRETQATAIDVQRF